MNADFLSLFQDSLDEVTALLGSPFTYNGNTYTGVINEVEVVSTLIDGGQLEGLATVIIVPIAQLTTAPTIGQTVKVDTRTLRIEKVKSDEISHELTCVSAAN